MEIPVLKYNLIQWLIKLEDPQILSYLESIAQLNEGQDFWEELSEKEKEGIQEALDSIERGEGIPHDQVMSDIKTKYGL